ncbi:MAG TPA: NAD(P)/FAD-dependent oxidoreductase [Phycisphaerae bacterium]|nr:NAD(P)/FAD-dependent oxidoreductase [Phycisphaerae bacterium]
MKKSYDAIVIGGGPAGSATATFLAGSGLQVLLLEADRHPRHHIGESLLPASMPIMQELGISAALLHERFQAKHGARFYHPPTDRMATFEFDPSPGFTTPAFQVLREHLDALLLERARVAGAEVIEDARVEAVDENEGRVAVADGRTFEAGMVVDASGRRAIIASRRGSRRWLKDYGRVGIYSYLKNLPPHDNEDSRYITMYLFPGGWVWLIPLADGRTSVGVVYREVPTVHPPTGQSKERALFEHAMGDLPRLRQRLASAVATDSYRAIGDYSYAIEEKFGERFVLVGDAAGFLDPIFSSGVHLALSSARRASEGIVKKLRTGSDSGLRSYDNYMNVGFRVFQSFVDRFYNRSLVENLFFMENKPPHMHAAITRILAGHVWDGDNPVLKLLGVPSGAAV